VKTGLDGADGDGQSSGDIFKGETNDKAHEDDLTMSSRQSGDDRGKFSFLCGRRGGESVERVGCSGKFVGFAAQADADVFDCGIEEGGETAGQFEAGELGEKVDEGFLEDVKSLIGISGETSGQREGPVLIAMIKRVECRFVAGVGGGDKLLIGSRVAGRIGGHGGSLTCGGKLKMMATERAAEDR